jgi:ABC-2 type transport system ATP-binding protein
LAGVIDQFSGYKLLTFEFAAGHQPNLCLFGEIIDETWPKVQIRVSRSEVPKILAEVLRDNPIDDVSVEDVPLEEVIAKMFRDSAIDH